ncbi:MAG: RdgB/HAM1 family non-canonical purine NTP pyrophosphatase [Candidatus Sumerlaeaceae bacterium]|nr:RdgB/HAM1 family non-canonical purine NTP pyrophosphatase [Candidatus Sumerlaeaceae bacterium]
MMRKLVIATTNRGKLRELEKLLEGMNVELLTALDFPAIEAPEETGATFEENAKLKALYYAEKTGEACVADDSGLVVDALGGRPGVHSARYAATDAERIAKILAEMRDVAGAHRAARFVCAAALALPIPTPHVVAIEEGRLEGHIAYEPRGTNGFGFDPVFYVEELGCHLAEVATEVKNTVSHRARAFARLKPWLAQWLEGKLT